MQMHQKNMPEQHGKLNTNAHSFSMSSDIDSDVDDHVGRDCSVTAVFVVINTVSSLAAIIRRESKQADKLSSEI